MERFFSIEDELSSLLKEKEKELKNEAEWLKHGMNQLYTLHAYYQEIHDIAHDISFDSAYEYCKEKNIDLSNIEDKKTDSRLESKLNDIRNKIGFHDDTSLEQIRDEIFEFVFEITFTTVIFGQSMGFANFERVLQASYKTVYIDIAKFFATNFTEIINTAYSRAQKIDLDHDAQFLKQNIELLTNLNHEGEFKTQLQPWISHLRRVVDTLEHLHSKPSAKST